MALTFEAEISQAIFDVLPELGPFTDQHREYDPINYVTDTYTGDPIPTQEDMQLYMFGTQAQDRWASATQHYESVGEWPSDFPEAYPAPGPYGWGAVEQSTQAVASNYVIDPMGYSRSSGGFYSWGDLATIYNSTPIETVAKQAQRYESTGQTAKAELTRALYGAPRAEWREDDFAAIRDQEKRFATGQIDVGMDPQMVSAMLSRRERERSQRRYKGGTVVSQGLLGTTLEQYKRYLGG